MPRLFVAAWPPPAAIAMLHDLPRPDVDGLRWSRPDQWHVTLRFLGEADIHDVTERLVGAHLPSATATFGPAVDRLGERILMIPVGGLDELAAAVRRATTGLGEPPGRHFRGHLTIARTRRPVDMPLLGTAVSGAFAVHEVALVESDLHADGTRYTTIATFPTG